MYRKIEETKMNSKAFGNTGATIAWAEDFIYAVEERPWILKLLFRIAVGRFAWREFMGIVESLLLSGGFYPKNVGYSHREQEYHKEKICLWRIR